MTTRPCRGWRLRSCSLAFRAAARSRPARRALRRRSPTPGRAFRPRPLHARRGTSSCSADMGTSRGSTRSSPAATSSGRASRARTRLSAAPTSRTRGAIGFATSSRRLRRPSSGVSYTIKPTAYWYWGGKKVPVTYRDFVYTLQKIDDPNDDVASRAGLQPARSDRLPHTAATSR